MQKIKILLLFSFLSCSQWCISQSFSKIPDSLKKYSHTDLYNKMNSELNMNIINYRRVYIYAQTNLLKAQKENNNLEIIYGYNALADAFKELEIRLKYSDTAISIAKDKMPDKLSYLHYSRGLTFYNQNRLKEALNSFLIANKKSDNSSVDLDTRILHSIAMVKKTQGNYKDALSMLKKCEEIAKKNEHSKYLLYLFSLAELYNRMDQIDLSEKYTNIGLGLRKENPSGEYYYPYFISNKGKNYYRRKEYNNAILDLTSSSKSFKANNDFSNYAENSFYLGECYREQHQDEKAMVYYKKVDSIFIAKNDIYPLTIPAYQHLITYYKNKKNYQQVVYYSDQFIKADKILDDNYKYITLKIAKIYDIQKVITQKEKAITTLKNNKIIFIITIGLLLLGILLLSIWFYKSYWKKKSELEKEKELFEAYIKETKEKEAIVIYESQNDDLKVIKKRDISSVDKNIVGNIEKGLAIYVRELKFLKTYTIGELAKELNTNSDYLSIVINEKKGGNFAFYVNTLRIKFIIKKLETEKKFLNYSIQALSIECGYTNVETFTRAFISHTKMKPTEFIKQLKDKQLYTSQPSISKSRV